jgi:hypothetical protein
MRFLIYNHDRIANILCSACIVFLAVAAYGQGEPVTLIGHVEAMIAMAADDPQGDVTVTLDPSTGGGDQPGQREQLLL